MSSSFAIAKSIFVSVSAFVKEIFQVKLTGAIHPSSIKCENSQKDGAKIRYFSLYRVLQPVFVISD